MPDIWVPIGVGRSDFVEKRSRFIGEARKASSAEEARGIIADLRDEHPKSRHVVWAYILGSDGALKGLSDDGEPHGTAGRPVLDPIEGQGLSDTLVTVVRYFGGVKLGTGGLVSAYGRSCREALEAMPREKLIPCDRLSLVVDYAIYERLLILIEDEGGRVINDSFESDVSLTVDIPTVRLEAFRRYVNDLSRGSAIVERF